MKLIRILPVVSLGLVLGVASISTCSNPPIDFPYAEPPEGEPPRAVTLATGSLTLHVRVLGPEGQPLEGAGVSLDQAGRPHYGWTDADGRVSLGELWPEETARVRVVALGYQATAFEAVDLEQSSAAEPREFVLDRPVGTPPALSDLRLANLEGFVRLPPGALSDEEDPYELLLTPTLAPTDPSSGIPRRVPVARDGSFTVDLLREGEYRATLLAPEDRGGRGPDLLADASGSSPVLRHDLDAETRGVELFATAGSIRGRALDIAVGDGEAAGVRGALIRAERIVEQRDGLEPRVDPSSFRSTRTNALGDFELLDLPPGPYRVTLVAGRRRQQRRIEVLARGEFRLDLDPEEGTTR